MLETLGLFALIGLILWGLFWLTRWGDRVAQRSAVRLAKRLTDEYLSRWWLRNGSHSRSTFVWRRAVLECVIWCVVWLAFGLLFGKTVLPGGVLLYWIWRRTGHTWDANVAECRVRGLAEPAAEVPATSELFGEGFAPGVQEAFFIHLQDETQGPYAKDQLESMWNSGGVTADALYWQEKAEAWLPLRDLIKPPKVNNPPAPAPVILASRVWTWREWFAAAVVALILLLFVLAAFRDNPQATSTEASPSAAVVVPSPLPATVATDFAAKQALVAQQVRNEYPDLDDPKSPLFQVATVVRNEWNSSNDERLHKESFARLLVEEARRRLASAQTQAQSLASPGSGGTASPDSAFPAMEQDATKAVSPHIPSLPFPPEEFQRSQSACQMIATTYFPELAVENSPLNREFVARFKQHKASGDAFFQEPDWPVRLTEESVRALQP